LGLSTLVYDLQTLVFFMHGGQAQLTSNMTKTGVSQPRRIRNWSRTTNQTQAAGNDVQIARKPSEKNLKKLTLIAPLFVFCLFERPAHGQQIDAAFGFGTLSSAGGKTSGGLLFPTAGGGGYPSFSADFLVIHRLGVEGEVYWRAKQNLYGGAEPYRPIFYAFNAIWVPKLTKSVTAEVLAGVGGEDLRFYSGLNYNVFAGYTNYTSSNHFMGDFGGGIRAYVWRNAFIRPEVRLYLIRNNVEFSSNYAARYSVSLGYSFGGR
jgi:hypothetical protein